MKLLGLYSILNHILIKVNGLLCFFMFSFLFISCKKDKINLTAFSGRPNIKVETILANFEIIWGMDFLPTGELIFGEKKGKLNLYNFKTNKLDEIIGLPKIDASNQGGLLDIKVDPNYSQSGWIYMCYNTSTPFYSLKLSRFKIKENKIYELQTVYTAFGAGGGHIGSRILFDLNRYLYLSIGEGPSTGGGVNVLNKNAQDITSPWGKIHRFNSDGSIPRNNPVFFGNSTNSSIFSLGHRNPQGLALNIKNGEIWQSEHGARGGDEINIIKSGNNYGWPYLSLGTNYDGTVISNGHDSINFTKPIFSWTPSIGACGISFINGSKFKGWSGSLVVSGLASQKLHRCIIENNQIAYDEIMLKDSGRVRNVIQGPDESLYVSVEGPGRVIKITPF